jgi:NADH-quinone oxidoreductase subunit C
MSIEGHPNLRKIRPTEARGQPLRKDFPLGETPTLFREGRYIIPSEFRAAVTGKDPGLTFYRGGSRKGYRALWADLMKAKEAK